MQAAVAQMVSMHLIAPVSVGHFGYPNIRRVWVLIGMEGGSSFLPSGGRRW